MMSIVFWGAIAIYAAVQCVKGIIKFFTKDD